MQLSDGHPEFSRDEMADKLDGLHSPPLCTTFNHKRPGICTTCKSWGKIQSPISLWQWEVAHTAERKRLIDAEVEKLTDKHQEHIKQGLDPILALRSLGRDVAALKTRDPEVTYDCAFKLMAFLSKEWGEKVVREMGTLAGLDDALAARWARKLHASRFGIADENDDKNRTTQPAANPAT